MPVQVSRIQDADDVARVVAAILSLRLPQPSFSVGLDGPAAIALEFEGQPYRLQVTPGVRHG
jgi:hypothetical protein